MSSPFAAVLREQDRAGGQPGAFDVVVTEQGIDGKFVGELCDDNVNLGGQAEDGDAGRVASTTTASSPSVPLTMTVSSWPSPVHCRGCQPGRVHLGDVSAGQVVDGDGVGAAEGERC